MLSCKQTVKILSAGELTWSKKVQVKLHLLICHHCRKFNAQLKIMVKGFKNLLEFKVNQVSDEKVQSMENEIIQKIRDE